MPLGPVPSELFASWQHTLVHWTQKTSHDTTLGLAAKHEQLAWLAARYRDAARSNPYDPIARDRLKGVQRAAMLAFSLPVAPDAGLKKSRGGMALLLAAVLGTGMCLWLTDMMRKNQAVESTAAVHRTTAR